MKNEDYRDRAIRLIRKTDNPVAPLLLHSFENGVEKMAQMIAPLCSEEQSNLYRERLLKDFSDEELERMSGDPNFILALLAMVKQSTIDFIKP